MAEQPVEQLPVADWTDQDLLTRDGAGDLLEEEIAAEQARLEELTRAAGDGESAAVTASQRRIAAMEEIRKSLPRSK